MKMSLHINFQVHNLGLAFGSIGSLSDFMTDRSMPIFDLISNLTDNKKKFGLD